MNKVQVVDGFCAEKMIAMEINLFWCLFPCYIKTVAYSPLSNMINIKNSPLISIHSFFGSPNGKRTNINKIQFKCRSSC